MDAVRSLGFETTAWFRVLRARTAYDHQSRLNVLCYLLASYHEIDFQESVNMA